MTVRALITALAVAGALLAPAASAQAQAPSPSPSPEELWDVYPANPGGAPIVPPEERVTGTRTSADDAASGGGPPLVPVPITITIAALAVVGGVVLWRRYRTRWGVSRELALRYREREDVAGTPEPPPAPPAPKPPIRRDYPQPARPAPPPPPPPPAPVRQVRLRSPLEGEPTQ